MHRIVFMATACGAARERTEHKTGDACQFSCTLSNPIFLLCRRSHMLVVRTNLDLLLALFVAGRCSRRPRVGGSCEARLDPGAHGVGQGPPWVADDQDPRAEVLDGRALCCLPDQLRGLLQGCPATAVSLVLVWSVRPVAADVFARNPRCLPRQDKTTVHEDNTRHPPHRQYVHW